MWAIVPVRSLTSAKSRLSPVLDALAREHLQRELLLRTLKAVEGCTSIDRALVVTRDPEVAVLAQGAGARTLSEPASDRTEPEGLLNAALDRAAEVALTEGAPAVLVLPSDLPRLDARALDEVVAKLPTDERSVAVFSDRHCDGTNALFCRPPGVLSFAFGPGSCERHARRGRNAGAKTVALSHPDVELDLDTPADLEALRDGGALEDSLETLLPRLDATSSNETGRSEPVLEPRSLPLSAPSASPGD
ncbi:MAG: 2-phospho-L-lactate guanylyltransferase [Acidobacteriota bacterium]